MVSEGMKKIENILSLNPDDFIRSFSSYMNEIHLYGPLKIIEESPTFLVQIIRRLVELDVAKLTKTAPQSIDMFMDILWESISLVATKKGLLDSVINDTIRVSVNFDASDSPLRSHFVINQGTLSGGSGMLHFKDQDWRYLATTETLLKALAGDIAWGKLKREGHPGLAPKMRPVLQAINSIIRGDA